MVPQDVGILINGSVPDLAGSRVECEYRPGVSTAATVHLDYGSAQIQTCPLLPHHSYQPILPGTGEARRRGGGPGRGRRSFAHTLVFPQII